MTDELGYLIRQLAGKLGKDNCYVDSRLRLASARDDVREMVAERYERLSAGSAGQPGRATAERCPSVTDLKLSGRSSVVSFVLMTGLVTAAAAGLFVLLDPRSQEYWVQRWEALAGFVRSLFGGG